MPVISFWNNSKGETGQTLSLIAMATYMAIMRNYKILVVDTKFNSDTISDCYWEYNKSNIVDEITTQRTDISTGVEGLAKAVLSNKSTPEIITNYTKIVFRDRLEILLGMKTTVKEEYDRIAPVYKEILQFAKRTYDMVFVDLENGFNDINNEILQVSDLIILNMNQKIKEVENLNEMRKSNEQILSSFKVLMNIGKYDRYSKYNSRNLARMLGERKELLCVPYCTQFFEASMEGKVADYFIKYNKIVDLTDENSMFAMDVKKDIERIIYRLQELQMRI